jgi:hypothetical protein
MARTNYYGYDTEVGTISTEVEINVTMEQLRDLVESVDPAELYEDNVDSLLETVASYIESDGDCNDFLNHITETFAFRMWATNNIDTITTIARDAIPEQSAISYGHIIGRTMDHMSEEEIKQFISGLFESSPQSVIQAGKLIGMNNHRPEDIAYIATMLRIHADVLDPQK